MLSSKQRAYLRSMSQQLDTIFQIGKGGITDEICFQISNALEARELIKCRVLENSGYTAREAAEKNPDVRPRGLRFLLQPTHSHLFPPAREGVSLQWGARWCLGEF